MFPEISLHVLDVAQNSVKAGANFIEIEVFVHTDAKRMKVRIADNGCGMSEEQLSACVDPFFTSRTTRKVGLGIPFFKQSAECTGGTFFITSQEGKGTVVVAEYCTDHIDCLPLGDISETIYSLVLMNKDIDFLYRYEEDGQEEVFDTRI